MVCTVCLCPKKEWQAYIWVKQHLIWVCIVCLYFKIETLGLYGFSRGWSLSTVCLCLKKGTLCLCGLSGVWSSDCSGGALFDSRAIMLTILVKIHLIKLGTKYQMPKAWVWSVAYVLKRDARLRWVKRSLIWVCIVCLCPSIETLGIYGLSSLSWSALFAYVLKRDDMLIWVKQILNWVCAVCLYSKIEMLGVDERSLIWVCIVCLCPSIETLGIYGLSSLSWSALFAYVLKRDDMLIWVKQILNWVCAVCLYSKIEMLGVDGLSGVWARSALFALVFKRDNRITWIKRSPFK